MGLRGRAGYAKLTHAQVRDHGCSGQRQRDAGEVAPAELDLEHICVGDIFRWNVQHHTKLGAQVRRIMAAGELVGDELVEVVVRDRLALHDWNFGFIVDGFPRNDRQAAFFLESYDLDAVILLELDDTEVVRRVLARRLCEKCGLDYNLINDRPDVADVCDVCGGRLVSREDDTSEALATRLRTYHEHTRPIIELFERKEFVARVDASQPVEQVSTDIRRVLGLST